MITTPISNSSTFSLSVVLEKITPVLPLSEFTLVPMLLRGNPSWRTCMWLTRLSVAWAPVKTQAFNGGFQGYCC